MENGKTELAIRRQGDPYYVQRIWDAIKICREDRKAATLENVIKYCTKIPTMTAVDVEEQVKLLTLDKLLIKKTQIGVKGSKKGSDQIIYCAPLLSDMEPDPKHDWYCFICHKGGMVLTCNSCPRVHHIACLSECLTHLNEEEGANINLDDYTCPSCKELKSAKLDRDEIKELNHLLGYLCIRLEDKCPKDHMFYTWNPTASAEVYNAPFTTDRCATIIHNKHKRSPVPPPIDDSDAWRVPFLLFHRVTLGQMESKADRQVYKAAVQFRIDSATIVHNVAIFHGINSPLADNARSMHTDCLYELKEMKICTDCYRRSNEQNEPDWFSLPCNPHHMLVYAKAKGFPYWPAKVIAKIGDTYDVRFFGPTHDRAKIEKALVKPISVDVNTLVINKKSPNWLKAMEQLHRHQALLSHETLSPQEEDDTTDTEELPHRVPNNNTSLVTKEISIVLERLSPNLVRRFLPKKPVPSRNVAKRTGPLASQSGSKDVDDSSCCMENPTVADGNTLDSNNSEMTEVIRLDTEVDIATIDMEEFSVMMKVTDQERETMKLQHQAEILKLKNEYEAKIAELTNPKVAGQTYAAENGKYSASDVEAGPSNTVMLKRNHNGEILRVNYEERIAELIHQNDVLKQSHAKEVLAMKLSHANEVSTMKKQCDERIAFANQEIELIKTTNTFANQTLREDYEKLIFENKKKAWCHNCFNEGSFHCCLNTSYCGNDCQQIAWKAGHKKVCRRDRTKKT